MSSPKVSIIIPVYSVEKYVEKCARSLFEQTYKNIEYIFIDDCTPDKSIEIMKGIIQDYPSRSDQVKLYSFAKNKGIAFVRKFAIEHATGEYVIHCDSDDWVESGMVSHIVEMLEKNNGDLLFMNMIVESNGEVIKKNNIFSEDKERILKNLLTGKMQGALWACAVKNTIVKNKNILFPSGSFCEDLCLIVQYCLLAKKVLVSRNAYYHYVRRDNSLSYVNVDKDSILGQVKSAEMNFATIKEALIRHNVYNKYKRYFQIGEYTIKNNTLPLLIKPSDCFTIWKNYFSDINWALLMNSEIKITSRIKSLTILFGLYPLLMKVGILDKVTRTKLFE